MFRPGRAGHAAHAKRHVGDGVNARDDRQHRQLRHRCLQAGWDGSSAAGAVQAPFSVAACRRQRSSLQMRGPTSTCAMTFNQGRGRAHDLPPTTPPDIQAASPVVLQTKPKRPETPAPNRRCGTTHVNRRKRRVVWPVRSLLRQNIPRWRCRCLSERIQRHEPARQHIHAPKALLPAR